MNDDATGRFFHGSEFPRLFLLAAIALVGWGVAWQFFRQPAAQADPTPQAEGPPMPIEPDTSLEFETVTDKTLLGLRDSAAYKKLLDQAFADTPASLAAKARTDVFYAHLFDRPSHYRGVPIHILGNVGRVFRYESKLSHSGWLYEASILSTDSQQYPYTCVFEDVPKGFPIGVKVSERVVFNGYFLKLMRYQAGDGPRASPLLVGRIGWTPPAIDKPVSLFQTTRWLAGGVALMFLVSLVRWVSRLRKSFTPPPRVSILLDRPTEEIDPSALSEWVETVAQDDDENPDPAGPLSPL